MLRQLEDKDKQVVLQKHTKDGTVRCFVDDLPVSSKDDIEFHHIRPFSEGGPTEIDNIAPVCKEHHRRIRTLSLLEFRDKLKLDSFFQTAFKEKRSVRLDDILGARLGSAGFGRSTSSEISTGQIKANFGEDAEVFPLYKCPVTSYPYFYALVPIDHLKNDVDLQPRPLEPSRMWELYRHFLRYTQLAPAICRLVDGKILLFDGQHKSAAQIWAGRKTAMSPGSHLVCERDSSNEYQY